MMDLDIDRRGFLELAGSVVLLGSQESVAAQVDEPGFDGEADVYGLVLDANRPTQDQIDAEWDTYRLVHLDPTTGKKSHIDHTRDGWTDIPMSLEKYEDAFGYPVVKNPRNSLDLPSPYDFNEERYRYIENGVRIQDPDSDSTRFDGAGKAFNISPQAGDTIEFKTAEAPRYVVGHDAAASWAFQMISDLAGANDELTLFIEDSYELRFFGDGTAKAVTIEGGVDNVVATFDLDPDLTVPLRPELVFNWYDVGRAEYDLDYTSDNEQVTQMLATLTDDNDWISDDPIGRVGFRLDVSNSGIELAAGSMAYIPQTDSPPTGRPKPFALHNSDLAIAGNSTIAQSGYTVLGALRIDPERDDVFTTVTQLDMSGEQSVDSELSLKAVPEGQTDADFLDVDGDGTQEGPAYPRQMSPQNSVLQFTPNVTTFPTRTSALTGGEIPAGRLVGLSIENSAGTGSKTETFQNSFVKSRPIYKDDIVLIIGHTPGVANTQDPNIFGGTDQDW